LTMQFSATSSHLIPLGSKYSPEHPVIKHLQSLLSLNVKDQVSHPYGTTGKTIDSNVLIFTLLDIRWGDSSTLQFRRPTSCFLCLYFCNSIIHIWYPLFVHASP
jgi:hypothetical protein